jgi:uncharacterized protein YegL
VKPRATLIFFVTDGENTDQARTQQLLADSQARVDGICFHFIGVSNQAARFPFIEKLGKDFDNVGFTGVNRVRQWVQQTDGAINQFLIG